MASKFEIGDQVTLKANVTIPQLKRFIGIPAKLTELNIGEAETTFAVMFYPSPRAGIKIQVSYDDMMTWFERVEVEKTRAVPKSLAKWYADTLSSLNASHDV